MVWVRVNPNHNLPQTARTDQKHNLKESPSNQSEERIPDLSYERKHGQPDHWKQRCLRPWTDGSSLCLYHVGHFNVGFKCSYTLDYSATLFWSPIARSCCVHATQCKVVFVFELVWNTPSAKCRQGKLGDLHLTRTSMPYKWIAALKEKSGVKWIWDMFSMIASLKVRWRAKKSI